MSHATHEQRSATPTQRPLAAAARLSGRTAAAPVSVAPHLLTVLVADDDADMRRYVAGCLVGPVRILEASDGLDALRLARALTPDLVIADVVMPGLDGHALCEALHAGAATAAIPVLIVSGETRGPPGCADGFLSKPFNAACLRAAVGRLLVFP